MILIFGGAYQGKYNYAKEHFGSEKKIINNVDKWILEIIKEEKDITKEIDCFLKDNQDSVLICTDISCGVVPIDPVMRRWREETGRFMVKAESQSEEVIRLFCGIAMKIKS